MSPATVSAAHDQFSTVTRYSTGSSRNAATVRSFPAPLAAPVFRAGKTPMAPSAIAGALKAIAAVLGLRAMRAADTLHDWKGNLRMSPEKPTTPELGEETERTRPIYTHRRASDEGAEDDGQFVETMRRADAGLALIWRWGLIVVVLIGFGITIQTVISRSNDAADKASTMVKSFDDFKQEIRTRLDHIGSDASAASNDVRELKSQVSLLKEQMKEREDRQQLQDARVSANEKDIAFLKAVMVRGK